MGINAFTKLGNTVVFTTATTAPAAVRSKIISDCAAKEAAIQAATTVEELISAVSN